MDEPTNDLDIETLELLEELLISFDGTLLLVSHDRVFLDNVVTSTLVFEGNGRISEYVGGYTDWVNQRKADERGASPSQPAKRMPQKTAAPVKRKQSHQEQRELKRLPDLIEELEARRAELSARVNARDFYRSDREVIQKALHELKALDEELEHAYARWEKLESST
jgi:ATP-binding cassette subfamily F protein uup